MDKNYKEIFEVWGKAAVSFLCALWLLLLMGFMCGCRTQYVPVETVRTEYKDRVNAERVVDSVTDTRFVYVKGDTVIDWRDRVKWKEREVHDSIYIEKSDTIRVPYPVERKLTKWEKARMDLGGASLAGLGAVVVGLTVWLAIIRRKK